MAILIDSTIYSSTRTNHSSTLPYASSVSISAKNSTYSCSDEYIPKTFLLESKLSF